jgi:hypothetical protein
MATLLGVFELIVAGAVAHNAELKKRPVRTKGNGDTLVDGINVGPRSYHEPGYNCKINSIEVKSDVGLPDRVYIVDMACAGDGPSPRAQRVREIWALRKINSKDVLIMAGVAGATYPSIGILQRCKDRADTSSCNM